MAEQTKHSNHNHEGCSIPSYHSRDLLVREDIMEKAKHLAELILTTEEVQQFQKAEKLVQSHERLQEIIAQMKKKQKEIVAFESFQNKQMVEKIEGELSALQDELDGIPLVVEFQQSQTDVNYLLQLIISVIRDTIAEKIDLEHAQVEAPENCD